MPNSSRSPALSVRGRFGRLLMLKASDSPFWFTQIPVIVTGVWQELLIWTKRSRVWQPGPTLPKSTRGGSNSTQGFAAVPRSDTRCIDSSRLEIWNWTVPVTLGWKRVGAKVTGTFRTAPAGSSMLLIGVTE